MELPELLVVVFGSINVAGLVAIVTLLQGVHTRQTDALREQINMLNAVRATEVVKELEALQQLLREQARLNNEKLTAADAQLRHALDQHAQAERRLLDTLLSQNALREQLDRIQSQRQFEELYRSREQASALYWSATANLLHHLRESLTNTVGFLDLFESGNADVHELKQVVRRSSETILEIVTEIIRLANEKHPPESPDPEPQSA